MATQTSRFFMNGVYIISLQSVQVYEILIIKATVSRKLPQILTATSL